MTDDFMTLLTDLPSWEEKYEMLIDLGKRLPPFSESERSDGTFVPGCMSQIWIKMTPDDAGRYHFDGDSDAMIVKGILALFFHILEGKTKDEIISFDFGALFNKIGLLENLSPNRRNGLSVMERYIKEHVTR